MGINSKIAIAVLASMLGGLGAVAPGTPAMASVSLVGVYVDKSTGWPPRVKTFWSAVLRIFITISNHASQQMAKRNVSQKLLKEILNEGKKTQRNGVAYVRHGHYEARVNASTGNVITVVKLTGGGGGGGGGGV